MVTLQNVKDGTKKINYNGSYSIYKITNIYTLNFYIGKSINIRKRLGHHISGLEHDKNNKNFLYEFNLCKKDLSAYKFEILVETMNKEELDRLEKYYIKEYSDKVLFNITHNTKAIDFEKEYPQEACWMDMLEPGYKSILNCYINWYKNIKLERKLICKNLFEILSKDGENLKTKLKGLSFIRHLTYGRSGLIRVHINYISISLINTLIEERSINLISKIVDGNIHKESVRRIIANSNSFSKEIESIKDLDEFLYWLLEVLDDDEELDMTLLDFALYYAAYLYTQKKLIKQKF